MDLEKELSELTTKTCESEDRIRDFFRFCCPPSLQQTCREFCHGLSYGGTIVTDNEKDIRQQLDWNGYVQVLLAGLLAGNYDVTPTYIFHVRYFGGNFAFATKYIHGGYRLYRQNSNGLWYTSTAQTDPEEELRQCVTSLGVEMITRFLQECLSTFEKVEADLWQFMREKVKACERDAEYLFYQTHQLLFSQKDFVARSRALKEERDSLMKDMLHIQNELREIVAGIGASKSFAKSKALKALRERGEKLLQKFDTV